MAENGITMAWHGIAELTTSINAVISSADTVAKEIVAKGAAIIEREAKQNFVGAHPKGRPHVGGPFPNVVTKELRSSIYPTPIQSDGAHVWSTSVGPRKLYGRRVELGYNGSRGYPYFNPAVKTAMPMIQELHKTMWDEYFRRVK